MEITSEVNDGIYEIVYSPLDDAVPIFLRGGKLIPFQPRQNELKNTKNLGNDFDLIIALTHNDKY